jgi:hypothetical protein
MSSAAAGVRNVTRSPRSLGRATLRTAKVHGVTQLALIGRVVT